MPSTRFDLSDLTPGVVVILGVLVLFFGLFLFYPLLHVLLNAFYLDEQFSMEFFGLMLQSPVQQRALMNSFELGIVTTALTTIISLPMAVALVRYDFIGKGLLGGLALVPMIMPPFVGAIGMKQMFARFGSINLFLLESGVIDAPIDWFGGGGFWGVVILEALHLYPIMYLNIAAGLANVDPSLEESARNVGAGGFRLFRTITFPLMLPGYFAGAIIVFIWAFTDLGTPLIFEFREVVAVQIFNMSTDVHANPMGYALVVFVVLVTLALFYLSKKFFGGRHYEMVARGHVMSASRPATSLETVLIWGMLLSITGIALIPHLSVVLTSITERWFMTVLPSDYTTAYYGQIFEHDLTLLSIKNSLWLSVMSTMIDIVIGITIAYLLTRRRFPFRDALDAVAMLPLALPGLVLAFGYISGFSGTVLDVRISPVPLLIIAYAVRRPALHGSRGLRRFPADERHTGRSIHEHGRRSPPDALENHHAAHHRQRGRGRHSLLLFCHARSERQPHPGHQGTVLSHYQGHLQPDGPYNRRTLHGERHGHAGHDPVGMQFALYR